MSYQNERFLDLVRREFDRMWGERNIPNRTGRVTSYDPSTHTAKVMLQPEGKETEFLPIAVHHIGAGFGIFIGLTPGDGTNSGDQVEIAFQEGDRESGRIIGRIASDADTPVQVQSGEIILKHQNGNYAWFKQDGSLTLFHGKSENYATLDKDGNAATYIKDPTKTQHYLGGDPAKGGAFAPVATSSGPSPYAQARIS